MCVCSFSKLFVFHGYVHVLCLTLLISVSVTCVTQSACHAHSHLSTICNQLSCLHFPIHLSPLFSLYTHRQRIDWVSTNDTFPVLLCANLCVSFVCIIRKFCCLNVCFCFKISSFYGSPHVRLNSGSKSATDHRAKS